MKNFKLQEPTLRLLERKNISQLFPMQLEVASCLLKRESIAFCSPTGSGKTLAYVLPLLQILKDNDQVKVVIFVANSQIIAQIGQWVDYLKNPSIPALVLSNSGNIKHQKTKLKQRKPRLILANIERFYKVYNFSKDLASGFSYLVIDEFDLFLKADKLNLLKRYLADNSNDTNICISSATLRQKHIHKLGLGDIKWLDYGSLPKNIEHFRYKVSANKQEIALVKLIKAQKISQALIFVNSTSHTSHISKFLKKNKLLAEDFSSYKDKLKRKEVLKKLHNRVISFIVTTDALARGTDIDDVTVINYAPARDITSYIHRSGRTARAGKMGKCYNMTTSKNYFVVDKIANKLDLNLQDI